MKIWYSALLCENKIFQNLRLKQVFYKKAPSRAAWCVQVCDRKKQHLIFGERRVKEKYK